MACVYQSAETRLKRHLRLPTQFPQLACIGDDESEGVWSRRDQGSEPVGSPEQCGQTVGDFPDGHSFSGAQIHRSIQTSLGDSEDGPSQIADVDVVLGAFGCLENNFIASTEARDER